MRKKQMIISGVGVLIVLFIMYGTKIGIPGITQYDSNFQLLDMQFSYSAENVTNMIEGIGIEGVKHYLYYLGVDMIFIVVLLVFQTNLSYVIAARYENVKVLLVCFAIGRFVFDLMEDSILARLMKQVIPFTDYNIRNASLCTSAKFIMMYSWFILAGITIVRSRLGKKAGEK